MIGAGIGLVPSASTGGALVVTLVDSVDPVITAVNFAYAVVVTNAGTTDASSVVATVTLDASVVYVGGAGTGWTFGSAGQVITCTLAADLVPGPSTTATITVTSGGAALTASSTAQATSSSTPASLLVTTTTAVKLVTKDATDGRRYPSSLTEWTDFNAYHMAIGTANFPNVLPFALHLCQEAAGNLADSIGAFPLAVTGTGVSYQNAMPGSARLAFKTTSGTTGLANTTDAALPNILTASALTMAVANVTTTAATRDVVLIGATALRMMAKTLLASGFAQGLLVGNTVNGANNMNGLTTWWNVGINRSSGTAVFYSDIERLVPTFAATASGQQIAIGNIVSGCATALYSYLVHFRDAAAEMSVAGQKALQTSLGWSPLWS